MPERKLELIDRQLYIGTLAGSRRMAWQLLRDYGVGFALRYGTATQWIEALRGVFAPQGKLDSAESWFTWARSVAYDAEPPTTGPMMSSAHSRIYDLLHWSLHSFAQQTRLGSLYGRDIVCRLNDNGVTPDLFFYDNARSRQMTEYFFDGAPNLIIEILLPHSAEIDLNRKRTLYEAAGVPEYWIFDPEAETATFLRIGDYGHYDLAYADEDGGFGRKRPRIASLATAAMANGSPPMERRPVRPVSAN